MLEQFLGPDYLDNPPTKLFVTLIDNKGGPPLTVAETAAVLLRFERTARLIVALDRFRRLSLESFPITENYSLRRYRDYVRRASARIDNSFNDFEVENIIRLARVPDILDNKELELQISLYGSAYFNPTYWKILASGTAGVMLIGGLVWAGIQCNHQIGAPECRIRAQEFANERMKALELQARREGYLSPNISMSQKYIVEGLNAAIAHCDNLIGRPHVKVSPKDWEIEVSIK